MTDSDERKVQVMFGLRRTDAAEHGRLGSNHLRFSVVEALDLDTLVAKYGPEI
jgi:hypothetical protein